VLTVQGGLAEFERELITARTASGRDRAKAVGVRFGRQPKLNAAAWAVASSIMPAPQASQSC
jgi:DNA invertase Pin-like site-specific DNA recombinase